MQDRMNVTMSVHNMKPDHVSVSVGTRGIANWLDLRFGQDCKAVEITVFADSREALREILSLLAMSAENHLIDMDAESGEYEGSEDLMRALNDKF